jgi:hypothetical protein
VCYPATTESASTLCADFTAGLYAVTCVGSAAYDANNDGWTDASDGPVVRSMHRPGDGAVHRRSAPLHRNGRCTGATSDPEGFNTGFGWVRVRILSWREIR